MPHHGEAAPGVGVAGIFQGRYIKGLYEMVKSAVGCVANQVYVFPLQSMTRTLTIDALAYLQEAVIGGNYRIGLYGMGAPNPDLPDGAPLIWQSPAIATVAGLTEWVSGLFHQFVPADGIQVIGWIAVIFSSSANRIFSVTNYAGVGNQAVTVRMYAAGAFALINPCPVTVMTNRETCVWARVSSVP